MKKIYHSIKGKKLQIFFLMYILMLVPTMSLIAQNIPVSTLIAGFSMCFGLLTVIFILSSFMTTRGIKIFYSILLAITIIPSSILLSYLIIAKVLLSGGTITTLFETNTDEAREFITQINPWIVIGIALYVLFPIVMIFKMKQVTFHRVGKHKNTFFTCILLLLLFLAVEPVAQRIYFVDFYRVFADYKIQRRREEKAIAQRQTMPFEVQRIPDKAPQTLILVIGESLSRHHMSLYDYNRNTNPQLSAKRSNLKIYRDIVSPQVHTIPVLRSALTFADSKHPEKLTEQPSVFELFNRAGYETYLISNQPFKDSSSSYEALLKLAKHTTDLSKTNQPDGILLQSLTKAMEEKTDKPKFIILHLMGNHIGYKYRYPAKFNFFNQKKHPINKEELTAEAKKTIDEYDNSVRYNDYLISSIIDMLDKERKPTAMLYFSDHGEEVYEFRDFTGHAYEKVSTYMCDIPFILWMSNEYEQMRKDMVFDVERPYSTVDALYSLSDLGGLRYDGYNESRSLFSIRFTPRTRRVGNFSYENVIELTEQAKQRQQETTTSKTFFNNLTKEWKQVMNLSDKALSSPLSKK